MTEPTKASPASRAPKAAAKGTTAGAKKVHADADRDNIKAGEAALRDAGKLPLPAKGARKAAGRAPKTGAKPATSAGSRASKSKAAGPAPAPARKETPSASPPAFGDFGAWVNTAAELQQAGLKAGTELADTQLTALRTSAALGMKLADAAMAQSRIHLTAMQAVITAADLQRRIVGQALDALNQQTGTFRDMMTGWAGASAKSWSAFESFLPSGRR